MIPYHHIVTCKQRQEYAEHVDLFLKWLLLIKQSEL